MKLSQLAQLMEQGHDLQRRLDAANRVIKAFEAVKGDMVACIAFSVPPGTPESDYGRSHRFGVEALPITKAFAISAAVREREKVLAELRDLGVELDEANEGEH
jgi:hypothetical protein